MPVRSRAVCQSRRGLTDMSEPNPEPIKHRSSRKVALLLAEINRTIQTIESNGQTGSVAHQRLLAQKQQLLGLRSQGRVLKNPTPSAPEPKGSGKFTPWPESEAPEPWPENVKRWCPICRIFVLADLFENSLRHDPAKLEACWAAHNKNIHETRFCSSTGDITQ